MYMACEPYAIENPDTQRKRARKEEIHKGNRSTVARMYAASRGVIKSAAWYAACGHIQNKADKYERTDHGNGRSRCVFPRQVGRGLKRCKHEWRGRTFEPDIGPNR